MVMLNGTSIRSPELRIFISMRNLEPGLVSPSKSTEPMAKSGPILLSEEMSQGLLAELPSVDVSTHPASSLPLAQHAILDCVESVEGSPCSAKL